MKILFAGDYSGCHATLAAELRRRGHEVTVASDGSRCMLTDRDIDLSRRPGMAGAIGYLGKLFALWPKLKGYDVVQIINPNFLHLRPGKIRYFFRELKRNNGAIGLTLAGSDPVFVKGCVEDDLFRYSEFRIGSEKTSYVRATPGIEYRWLNGGMGDHCRFIYENVDAAMSLLYEYHVASAPYLGDRLTYIGIPVDLTRIRQPKGMPGVSEKVNVLVGIKSEMEIMKGTGLLLEAAREVESRHPELCEVGVARDLPLDEYLRRLESAHVVADQLYSYTPATNALQTMAMGKVALSGAEPEYYDFIGEEKMRPIVNVTPEPGQAAAQIERLVTDRTLLTGLASQGRAFVERHNAAGVVADRFLQAWEKVL